MSNPLAIAAVTATLQQMLNNSNTGVGSNLPSSLPTSLNLNSISVTTKPPDRARQAGDTTNQLNLFLYQTVPNAAWRNMSLPRQNQPGDTGLPPVALTLHYLLSAYASGDDDVAAHILLGQALRIFNDNAVLNQDDIRNALPGNDLYAQIERVRITPQTFSIEEISKLWTAFATSYRVSSAFEVSVVLIESKRPSRTPQPVLSRGKQDCGVQVLAGSSLPVLESVAMPNQQSSAILGDQPVLTGQNLAGFSAVRFTLASTLLPAYPPILLTPPAAQAVDQTITVNLPAAGSAAGAAWVAGIYSVAVLVKQSAGGEAQSWSSNELAFLLAPTIVSFTNLAAGNVLAHDAGTGNATLTLTCSPAVALAPYDSTTDTVTMRFAQQVLLLLIPLAAAPALQISPQPPATPATPPASVTDLTFIFPVAASQLGKYWVRLRVDGADLPLVNRSVSPPQFDVSQQITLT